MKKLVIPTFLLLFIFKLSGQTEEVSNLSRCSSKFLIEWNKAVDDQYGLNVIDPENHVIGFIAAKKGGHFWDEVAALKLGVTDHDNWIPQTGNKEVCCGNLDKFKLYDSQDPWFGIDYDNGEEDYGFYINPDSIHRWILDDALPLLKAKYSRKVLFDIDSRFQNAYPTFDDYLFNGSEWHEGQKPERHIHVEAEIDPHSNFWSYGGFDIAGKISRFNDQNVCVYGPYVVEKIHDYRPEIHPAEAFWTTLKDGQTANVFIWQDNSNRFNDSIAKVVPVQTSQGETYEVRYFPTGLNWAIGPKKNKIRIPFEAHDGYIDEFSVRLGDAYSKDVHHKRPSIERNTTSIYSLKAEGKQVVQVTEEYPQLYELSTKKCRDGSAVKGFVDLDVEMGSNQMGGHGYIHLEIVKNEKYIGKQRWFIAEGNNGSPFLNGFKLSKYEHGDFNNFQYVDLNSDGETDVLETRIDGKWYVSYSAKTPWQFYHDEPGSQGSIASEYRFGNFDERRPGDEVIRIKDAGVEILGEPEEVRTMDGLVTIKRRFKKYSHPDIQIPVTNFRLADLDGNGTLDLISMHQGKLSASLNGGRSSWRTIVNKNIPLVMLHQMREGVQQDIDNPNNSIGEGNRQINLDKIFFVTTENPISTYRAADAPKPRPRSTSARDRIRNVTKTKARENDKMALPNVGMRSNQNRAVNNLVYKSGNKLWATNIYLKEWIELEVKLNGSINFFKMDDNVSSYRFIQGDFNADYNTDFIFYDADKKRIGYQSFSKNSGVSDILRNQSYPRGMGAIGVGDFNGDGYMDVLENGGPLKQNIMPELAPQDVFVQKVNQRSIRYLNGNLLVDVDLYKQGPPRLFKDPIRTVVNQKAKAKLIKPLNPKTINVAGTEIGYRLAIVNNISENSMNRFGTAISSLLNNNLRIVLTGEKSLNIELIPMYGVIRNDKIEVLEDNLFTEGMNMAMAKQVDSLTTKYFGSMDNFKLTKQIEVSLVSNETTTLLDESDYAANGFEILHKDGILKNGITSFINKKPSAAFSINVKLTLKDPYEITKTIEKIIILK